MSPMSAHLVSIFYLACFAFVAKKAFALYRGFRSLGNCPGKVIVWIQPFHAASFLLGSIFPLKGSVGSWYARFTHYKNYGSTCISSVHFWTNTPIYWISDADALKVVTSDRGGHIIKDAETYDILRVFGESILGAEGADWRRHRTVVNPAFSESNIALVWYECQRLAREWFQEIDESGVKSGTTGVEVELNSAFTKIGLHIISAAGFGRRMPWSPEELAEIPSGHTLPFDQTIFGFLRLIFVRVIVPTWAFGLVERVKIPFVSGILKEVKLYSEEMRLHIMDMISLARAGVYQWENEGGGIGEKGQGINAALLKNLVEANMTYSEKSSKRLTDSELFSDTLAFLLAGHETVAHTLCFVMGFMALYPEVQAKVFDEVSKLWPDGVPQSDQPASHKGCMTSLEYTTAAIYEAMRLYPVVPRLSKIVVNDCILQARRFIPTHDGNAQVTGTFDVCIEKGSYILMDLAALHRNPLHWGKDAEKYKPERFIDTDDYRWPRDALLSFSAGPRSCIGQRFAQAEAICLLASIVREYELLLPEDLIGLPLEDQEKRLMKWIPGATIIPTDARVRFRRRKGLGDL